MMAVEKLPMDIKAKLKAFKREFDKELEAYLDDAIEQAQDKDAYMAEALEYVKTFILAGGKRVRPALMYYGYLAAGGRDKHKILEACVSIELTHAFMLIHDDIMDNDDTRHGVDTVHHHFQKQCKKLFPNANAHQFGSSMGISLGDMVAALGSRRLFTTEFESELIVEALRKLQDIVALTVIGQVKDVKMSFAKNATQEDVIQMYEYKTARYTIEGPLHLGVILSGGNKDLADRFTKYAIPLGIVFQIQDDILGLFGDEEKTGKSVGSDVQEGKVTLLIVKAREAATSQQRKVLDSLLGKDDVTVEEVEKVRSIVRETGSLEYAQLLANEYIQEGKVALENLSIDDDEVRTFFASLAEYLANREV